MYVFVKIKYSVKTWKMRNLLCFITGEPNFGLEMSRNFLTYKYIYLLHFYSYVFCIYSQLQRN